MKKVYKILIVKKVSADKYKLYYAKLMIYKSQFLFVSGFFFLRCRIFISGIKYYHKLIEYINLRWFYIIATKAQ